MANTSPGSEDAFAALMNATASARLKNSHWVNPPVFPRRSHYSTAHDLALLGRALIRDYPEA